MPVRVYQYAARIAPESIPLAQSLLWEAHVMKNDLIKIERDVFYRKRDFLLTLSPELASLKAAEAEAETKLKDARDACSAYKAEHKCSAPSVPLALAVDAAHAELRHIWAECKRLSTPLYKSPEFKSFEKQLQQERKERFLAVYAERVSNGPNNPTTYNKIKEDVERAVKMSLKHGGPPRWHVFEGDGKLSVQLVTQNGDKPQRWPVSAVLDGKAGCFSATPDQSSVVNPHRNSRRGSEARRWRAYLRFKCGKGKGSRLKENCTGLDLSIRFHRPLPADAEVKNIHMVARRVARKTEWFIQFDLDREHWARPVPETDAQVAVDVGWRLLPRTDASDPFSGGMRVCAYGSESDPDAADTLVIPGDKIRKWRHVERLQSVQDRLFHEAKRVAQDALSGMPEDLRAAFKNIGQWRSPGALWKALREWERLGWQGDSRTYDRLLAWQYANGRIYKALSCLRLKLQRWRTNLYREFAARMARTYSGAIIEQTDWAVFCTNPQPEEGWTVPETVRWLQRIACVHSLNDALKHVMPVTKVNPAWTTQACHNCGHIDHFDAAAHVRHTCSSCGAEWDQDANAVVNLLRGAGKDLASGGGAA